ncbi:MAG: AMP-binding protein [Flavobacteriales bacterium]|nr:AMP-binding protein [Flavobacteriales bacterium]
MSVNIESPTVEFLAKEELKNYQLDRLKSLLDYLNEHSQHYRELFAKEGINPEDIDSLEDLKKIPFTQKKDLAENPDRFLCVEKSTIAEFVTTSGTIGNPITVYLTRNDIDRLAYNEAISMLKAGCTSNDVFQLATTMDKRFMAGLAYCEGVRKLDAGLIRVGASSPSLQWDSIERFKPTVLIAIPSFVLTLIDYAKANGIDYRNSSLKKVIAIGQPIRNTDLSLNKIGKRIEEEWGLSVYSTYASTEMGCAFTECGFGTGGHLHPDLLYMEVVDEDGNEVAHGEEGEIVVTTLGVEAMPLLRYKTGDIAVKYDDTCSCGRTSGRLGPIIGRKQQMVKYKGTTVHPSALIPFLDSHKGVRSYLIELSTDELGLDVLSVLVAEENCDAEKAQQLTNEMGDFLKVKPQLRCIPQAQLKALILDPSSRKPIRILDKR